ncbi:MAG: CBS domain-containing protein [Steroidobacteraceae bacterium]
MVTVEHLLARKPRALHAIGPDEPVLEAIRLMAEHGIGAILVLRDTDLAGILSERDYARKVVLQGRSSSATPVWQIMSAPVVTVGLQHDLDHCMRLMTEQRIRHLPVVDDDGRQVVGMLSIGDLVKAVIDDQRRTIEQLEAYIHS